MESEAQPGTLYTANIALRTCCCPDWLRRQQPCKHLLSVRLWLACERLEAERQAEEPIPFPTRAYSDEDRFELTAKGLAALEASEPTPVA